jgi:hypothetical protein
MTGEQKTRSGVGHERRLRALTDEDVQALADEFEERLARRFYLNIGRGVWGLAWKAILVGLLFVASYGYFKGWKP